MALYEASMNFDAHMVLPFLTRLESVLGLGLDAAGLARFVSATPIEQTRSQKMTVRFQSRRIALQVEAFMDDSDAPDLYFFTPSQDLVNAIDGVMADFAEELGL